MKLEELQVDTHVSGVEPAGPVQGLHVQRGATDAVDLTYELLSGDVLKKTLFRTDEAKLAVSSGTRTWAFDAKAASFKLAAEATPTTPAPPSHPTPPPPPPPPQP